MARSTMPPVVSLTVANADQLIVSCTSLGISGVSIDLTTGGILVHLLFKGDREVLEFAKRIESLAG